MAETKPKNFRVHDDAAKEFRLFCETHGYSHAQGFDHLLGALELQQARLAIPNRETEISEFERCLKSLQSSYLTSLELATNAEARVPEEYARDLDRGTRMVEDYQKQIGDLQNQAKELSMQADKASELEAQVDELRQALISERAEAAERLTEQKQIVNVLNESLAVAQKKSNAYDALKAERDSLLLELQQCKLDAAQKLADAERAAHEAYKAASAELRKAEQEIGRLREELAKIQRNG